MTKGDSRVTALFGVLSPKIKRVAQLFFLRVTGDSSFLQAHVRNKKNKENRQVSPSSAVICHPSGLSTYLDSKKQGDSTFKRAVISAVTLRVVHLCR